MKDAGDIRIRPSMMMIGLLLALALLSTANLGLAIDERSTDSDTNRGVQELRIQSGCIATGDPRVCERVIDNARTGRLRSVRAQVAVELRRRRENTSQTGGPDANPSSTESQPAAGSRGDRAGGGSGVAPAPGSPGGGSPGGQAPAPANPPSGGGGGQGPGPGPGPAPPPQPGPPDSVVSDVLEAVGETVDGIVCQLGVCR